MDDNVRARHTLVDFACLAASGIASSPAAIPNKGIVGIPLTFRLDQSLALPHKHKELD